MLPVAGRPRRAGSCCPGRRADEPGAGARRCPEPRPSGEAGRAPRGGRRDRGGAPRSAAPRSAGPGRAAREPRPVPGAGGRRPGAATGLCARCLPRRRPPPPPHARADAAGESGGGDRRAPSRKPIPLISSRRVTNPMAGELTPDGDAPSPRPALPSAGGPAPRGSSAPAPGVRLRGGRRCPPGAGTAPSAPGGPACSWGLQGGFCSVSSLYEIFLSVSSRSLPVTGQLNYTLGCQK